MNTKETVTEFIINYIEQCTGYVPGEQDMYKKVDSFGLSSVEGMMLAGALEDTFNIDLPYDMMLGKDTLSDFIGKICELIQGI